MRIGSVCATAGAGAEFSFGISASIAVCAETADESVAKAARHKATREWKGRVTMQSENELKTENNEAGAAEGASNPFAGDALMRAASLNEQSFPHAALYIVGLPIGNAADITLRALWVLAAADAVACEDTRQTRKILDRYGIRTQTISVHEHNEVQASALLIERLAKGERIALVTDAGTPAVSDPGARAVEQVRNAGYRVIPVPGASAVITALSASGLKAYSFTFAGFVPPQAKQRREALSKYALRGDAFVLYEAPHRIRELMTDLAAQLEPERRIAVAREITKRFETFDVMTAVEVPAWCEAHEPRGEYVIAVDEKERKGAEVTPEVVAWAEAIAKELPLSKAAGIAARVSGVKRDTIYKLLESRREKAE